jgi:hypothetical protein
MEIEEEEPFDFGTNIKASFIEDYWSKEWRQCQTKYLTQLKSKKSSILWISQVQRKIWLITWEIWEQRNITLHNNGTTIHIHQMEALNEEIDQEWNTSLDQLPHQYTHLFNETKEDKGIVLIKN